MVELYCKVTVGCSLAVPPPPPPVATKPPDVAASKYARRRYAKPGSALSRAQRSGSVGRSARMSMEEGVRWKT